MAPLLATVLGFVLLLPTVFGFTWNYPVAARQCSTFSVVVNGTDVVFPLRVLLVPVGPSPLPFEVRKVMEVIFPTSSLNVSFTLPYPTNSKFVGLVSAIVFSFDELLIILGFMISGSRRVRLSWDCQYMDGIVIHRRILLRCHRKRRAFIHLCALAD